MSLGDIDKNTIIYRRNYDNSFFADKSKVYMREMIHKHVEEFLAAGGKIQYIPYGLTAYDLQEGFGILKYSKKFN